MMSSKFLLVFLAAACAVFDALGFVSPFLSSSPASSSISHSTTCPTRRDVSSLHRSSSSPSDNSDSNVYASDDNGEIELTAEEKQQLGNLVADAEWAGLSMEIADVVRTAVIEDLKKNSRDFLNKDDYSVGDFSKEIDKRVKAEVAKMREKDEYELGDLSVVLDSKVKELVCEMSGKDNYEFGDLSIEIDKKVKESVAQFCGQEKYEFGMLSKELAKRMKSGVASYTGKSGYKFGDITKTAVKNLSGKDDYQFGDITKNAVKNLTGKDDYEFGDVTKKFLGNVFNKDRK